MTEEVSNHIDIKEFRKRGYLQELNRQFLHPLGLALEVTIDENGDEVISGVWDSRDDPEGIYYDIANSDEERIERFSDNMMFIARERLKRKKEREKLFGEIIEPVPLSKKDKEQIMIDRTDGLL